MVKTMLAAVLVLGTAAGSLAQTASSARPPVQDDRANTHYRNAWTLLASEAWEDAAKEFQAAIDINRDFKLAYYGLGRARMAMKRFANAIRAYEKCRDLYAEQASKNFKNKADAEQAAKDDALLYDQAIQGLRGSPQSPATQLRIRELEQAKVNNQLKNRPLDTLSLTSSVPAFVSLALGSAYFRSERLQDAEREYKAAIQVEPKTGEAYSNLAVVYLETGRFSEAERAVASAKKAGFNVNPQLVDDIKNRKKGSSQ